MILRCNILGKYQMIKQSDINDCGAACFNAILKYFGVSVSLAKCREILKIDSNGTTFWGIAQGAKALGIKAVGLTGTPNELLESYKKKEIKMPMLARVIIDGVLEHYVIVYDIKKYFLIIGDPKDGRIHKISYEYFFSIWHGEIMVFSKEDSFRPNTYVSQVKNLYYNIFTTQKNLLLKTIVLSIILSIIALSTSFAIEYFVTSIQKNILTSNIVYFLSIILVIVYVLQLFINVIRGKFLTSIHASFEKNITMRSMRHLINLPITFFETKKTGEILTRFYDISKITSAMMDIGVSIILNLFIVFVCEITLFFKSPTLFVVSLFVVGLYAIILVLYNKPIQKASKALITNNAIYNSQLKELVDGIELYKVYSCGEYVADSIEKKIDNSISANKKHAMINFWQNSLSSFVASIGTVCVLTFGCQLALTSQIELGELILAYTLMSYVMTPINQIISSHSGIIGAIESKKRLNDILECSEERQTEQLCNFSFIGKDIKIQNLDFRYGSRELLLRDINITIESGKNIGIVGKSGCGKTTIAKLLLGLYNYENGSISIGNFSLESIPLKIMRQKIIYISSNSYFMTGTLRDNLLLGIEIDDETIYNAFKLCSCDDLLQDLPMGLDTYLTENASNLSTGQKQRISLIRAILRKPEILILDEITSNLDSINEEKIVNILQELPKDVTKIVISHKLSLVHKFDQIVVLDKGTVCGVGTHESLMSTSPLYSEMWSKQNKY